VQKQVPLAISLLLSLSPQQIFLLEQSQEEVGPGEPLFVSDELKRSFDPIQKQLLLDSKFWSLPRASFLKGHSGVSLKDIHYAEQEQPTLLRQHKANDQVMLKLMQQAPEFVKCLEPCQTRLLQNVMVHNLWLKFFFLSIQKEQIDRLQRY
jgi:hypothetical protein